MASGPADRIDQSVSDEQAHFASELLTTALMAMTRRMTTVEKDANQSEMRLRMKVAERRWACLIQKRLAAKLEAAQSLWDAADRRETHPPRIDEMLDQIQMETKMTMMMGDDQACMRCMRRDQIGIGLL
jgi:predicted lipoprotein